MGLFAKRTNQKRQSDCRNDNCFNRHDCNEHIYWQPFNRFDNHVIHFSDRQDTKVSRILYWHVFSKNLNVSCYLKIWLIQTLSCGIYPIWMQNYPCCFGCNSKIRLKRINLYLNRPNRRFILKNRFSKWYFGKHKVQLHPFQHSFSSLQWWFYPFQSVLSYQLKM